MIAADNEHDEAAFVVERIRELARDGVSPQEIAVFYRIHAQSRVLEEVMRAEHIPYQIIGGTSFFERAEVKDLLSYLRVVANPRSDVDLLRIINVPSRKIGDTTIDQLVAMADDEAHSLFDAIEPRSRAPDIGGAAKKKLLSFRDAHADAHGRGARPRARACSPKSVLDETRLSRRCSRTTTAPRADARLQNLRELVGSILDYEEEAARRGRGGDAHRLPRAGDALQRRRRARGRAARGDDDGARAPRASSSTRCSSPGWKRSSSPSEGLGSKRATRTSKRSAASPTWP